MLVLPGCSSVRLGYANGDTLVWWYLDGYMDFNRAQTPQVKQGLQQLFAWHRATQLPDYAGLLAQAQQAVLEPTTPAAACRWWQQVQDRLAPSIDRAVLEASQLVPQLGDAQFKHLEARYAKVLDEMRSDYLQPDADSRLAVSVQRAEARAEQLYGPLDELQRKVVAAGVAASPFDAQAWLQERQRRQRDTLQTLRNLAADRTEPPQRVAALRKLVERTQRSPDAAYRAYQQQLSDYNCAFAAQIHNATTPAQRQRARQRLKGWEEDLRALAGGAPS